MARVPTPPLAPKISTFSPAFILPKSLGRGIGVSRVEQTVSVTGSWETE